MEYSIGVDLGGTDIKAGLVSSSGNIVCRVVLPTYVDFGGPKRVAARIAEAVRQVIAERDAKNLKHADEVWVGLGAPGLIIAETGVVHFSPNFPGWTDVPLIRYVNAEFKKLYTRNPAAGYGAAPTSTPILKEMDNDVNVMTLGELRQGAGVGYKNIVGLTLGTGVGGGVVIDGQVYHGSQNTAGELGHTIVEPNGRYCGCGNQGCLEAYAGRRAIVERTEAKIRDGAETVLADILESGEPLTPLRIAEAAHAGDAVALEIFAETGRYIGIALTSIAHILNPQVAIIGGGIAEAGEDLLFQHIRAELTKRAMDIPAQMKVVKARLGNDAGIVGAAMLAFSGGTP